MNGYFIHSDHPFYSFESILREFKIDCFFVSRYRYVPREKRDFRITTEIKVTENFKENIEQMISSLSNDEDIAVHSLARLKNGKIVHIPMIDFSAKDFNDVYIACKKLQEDFPFDIDLFDSGRSYHAYLKTTIKKSCFLKYVGHLLLLNKPEVHEVVDTRWIGHRLIAGYFSLRWSCNSNNYFSSPTMIGSILFENKNT